jgi:peptidyl-prolyl cis-trans isomerase C
VLTGRDPNGSPRRVRDDAVVALDLPVWEPPMKRTFQSFLLASAVLATLLGGVACPKSPSGDGTKGEAVAGGAIARINGEEIARGDFDKQLERTRSRFQRAGRTVAPALEARLKENLVRKLVEEALIAQKAKAEGVSITAEELAAKVKEHKDRFGSEKAFASFLERTNQTEADVGADLEKTLLRDKLFAKLLASGEPTEADAKKYYEENLDKYKQKEQIKASHILVKVEKDATDKDKKAKLAEAKKVLAEVKKAGANFEEIAKKYSDGPTKDRGGDLGTFARGRMVKPFEDAAFAAKAGEIVGPVETQFGFHVIKVYEKTPEQQRSYDEVKEAIMTSLKARQKSKATRELLDKLKAEAKVEVLEPGISLDAKKPAAVTAGGAPLGVPGAEGADGADKPADAAATPPAPAPTEGGDKPAEGATN